MGWSRGDNLPQAVEEAVAQSLIDTLNLPENMYAFEDFPESPLGRSQFDGLYKNSRHAAILSSPHVYDGVEVSTLSVVRGILGMRTTHSTEFMAFTNYLMKAQVDLHEGKFWPPREMKPVMEWELLSDHGSAEFGYAYVLDHRQA